VKTLRAVTLAAAILAVAGCSSSVTPTPGSPASTGAQAAAIGSGFTLALPWDTSASPSHEIMCAYRSEGITAAGAAGATVGCAHHKNGPTGYTQDGDALDFDLHSGDSVRSVDAGIVRWAKAYAGSSSWSCYGNSIAIDEHQADGSVVTAFYAHLLSIKVAVGDAVTQGEEIGKAGGSGGGSNSACPNAYGPHLHIALYTNASYTGAKGSAVAAASLPSGATGSNEPVTSPPYGGTARLPEPWLACSRHSALASPPSGEDASCANLHAGDVLTVGGGQAPGKLSADWKWKATTVPPNPWDYSARQVLTNGRVALFDDGNATSKARTYAVCGFTETWGPAPGSGLKGQAFDPAEGKWSEIPQTTLVDEDDADQQLPSGRLLVVGKKFYNADGDANPAAAIYDFGTNSWQGIPAPKALPSYMGMAALTDGRIVMLDARDDTGNTAATLEAFNPRTQTWSVMWRPSTSIYWDQAAALPDGTVLMYGLDSTKSHSPYMVIFDPATSKARPVSAGSKKPWDGLQGTASGEVVAWSEDEISTTSDHQLVRAAVFDPTTDTWSAERKLTVPWGATVLVLRDGTVITAGGTLTTGSCDDDSLQVIPQATVTALDLATGKTTALPAMPQANSNPWLMELADGRLLDIDRVAAAWIFGP